MTIAVGTDAVTKQNNVGYDQVLCAIVMCGDRICLQELLGDSDRQHDYMHWSL